MDVLVQKSLVLFFAPCLIVLAGILGYELLRLFGLMRQPNEKELVIVLPLLSVLFGATVIGIAMYIVALVGWLSSSLIWSVLILQLCLAIARRDFFCMVREAYWTFINTLSVKSRWTKIISFLAMIIFFVFLILGLLTTVAPTLEADSASAYLNAANLFLRYQTFIDVGHFVGNMGKNGFLQLVYAMGIFSSQLGHAWLFLLASTGMLLIFLTIGNLVGYFIASILLVVLTTSNYAIDSIILPSKFDGLSFALSAAVLTVLMFACKGERHSWAFIFCGTLIGSLSGVSYNNIVVAVVLMLGLFSLTVDCRAAHRIRYISVATVAATIGAAPTYLQNFVLFGNPVYPFAGKLFGSGLGVTIPNDSYAFAYISELGREFSVSSITELIQLPLYLFARNDIPEIQARHDPWLAILLLASLGGSALLGMRLAVSGIARKGFVVPIHFFMLSSTGLWITYIFWGFNQHILRYFSAGFPFAVISCSIVGIMAWNSSLSVVSGWRRHVSAVAAIMFIGHMYYTWFPQIIQSARPAKVWLMNNQTEIEYVAEKFLYGGVTPYGRVIAELNSRLESGTKILSFIPGHYYFGSNIKTFSGNGSNTLPSPYGMAKPLSRFSDWQEWEAHLRSQKFSFLVIDPNTLYLTEQEKPIILDYLSHRHPYLSIDSILVFRIQ